MPAYGKDNFKETNINYLNKDFNSLKSSLVNYAKSYFPDTYRDFNETSPGMMLIEMNAYVGDVLSFYIDQQYREMLLPLAEERRNVINLAKMFGYKVKPIVPSYVNLKFTQEIAAKEGDVSKVDYTQGLIFDKGIRVKGTTNVVEFETLEPLDFQIEQSEDTNTIASFDVATGLTDSYTVSRTVMAVSGKEKSTTFTVGAPEKFKKLIISDTNVIDIISVVDSNGNNWYEVDYLAQDKVPIATHYTNDPNRSDSYTSITGETSEHSVPYSLEYIKTSKRFTRETNVNNTTSLIFGNGVLRDGYTIDKNYINLEQVGIVVPGQTNDLGESINPLLGDEYSTLGEAPNNTTLTVTYRVGGGIGANIPAGELTVIRSGQSMNGSYNGASISDLSVTNIAPARGGKDQESVDEIREKTRAFFSTQNRCVTKEDYQARILNMPAKFGNIAKVFVVRSGDEVDTDTATVEAFTSQVEQASTAIQTQVSSLTSWRDEIIGYQGLTLNNQDVINKINNEITTLQNTDSQVNNISTSYGDLTIFNLSSVKVYILSYDNRRNLIGSPSHDNVLETSTLPATMLSNIKNHLSEFRMLTDSVEIQDGYVINFGVMFEVTAEKYADKQQVKLRCIDKIKEYFQIDKMQFNQPIYKSQLEYEIMGIEGVRSIGHITLTQDLDYFYDSPTAEQRINPPTYFYSFDSANSEYTTTGGTSDYGYYYDFEAAQYDDFGNNLGIIKPALSVGQGATPAVFELKNPNQNIQGRVL